MDSLHTKRFIVLAVATVTVIVFALIGLSVMNNELQKSLITAKNNVQVSSVEETTNPAVEPTEEVDTNW